jgi:MFS transporter, DHA1 family, tetracycline resistance protein
MTNSAAPRNAAIQFILFSVFLDILTFGLIIPVLPHLILEFEGGNTRDTANIAAVFGIVWAVMQLLASPILGALSDQYGRRPILIFAKLGLGIDLVLMALAPSLWWLFLGRIISGATAASFSTANAYVADITPPEDRAKNFGYLQAMFGVGFIIGPALGGQLGDIDPRLPFWCAAGLSFLAALYGAFVLPESLPADKRTPFAWKKANPVAALGFLAEHRRLRPLALMHFLMQLAHAVMPAIMVLYVAYRYDWDTKEAGWMLAVVGIAGIIVQSLLVVPIIKRLGVERAMVLGLVCGTIGYFIYAFATEGWFFLLGIPIAAFMGIYGAAMQSIATRQVSPMEQGRLQGALASVMSIATLIGPGLYGFSFAAFIDTSAWYFFPGAPLAIAGLSACGGILVAWLSVLGKPAPAHGSPTQERT